jgi:hypothetical protein
MFFDGYDARSEIENAVFREAKQAWFIERPARNNADALRAGDSVMDLKNAGMYGCLEAKTEG